VGGLKFWKGVFYYRREFEKINPPNTIIVNSPKVFEKALERKYFPKKGG